MDRSRQKGKLKKRHKMENWHIYLVIGLVIALIGVIIFAVTNVMHRTTELTFPVVGQQNPTKSVNVSTSRCGDGICQPNEKKDSIVYCAYDCFS